MQELAKPGIIAPAVRICWQSACACADDWALVHAEGNWLHGLVGVIAMQHVTARVQTEEQSPPPDEPVEPPLLPVEPPLLPVEPPLLPVEPPLLPPSQAGIVWMHALAIVQSDIAAHVWALATIALELEQVAPELVLSMARQPVMHSCMVSTPPEH